MAHKVKIQLNDSGAWKDMIAIDRDQVNIGVAMLLAHELIKYVNPPGSRLTGRLVIADIQPVPVLAYWDANAGWVFRHEPGANGLNPLPNPPKPEIGATGAAGADRSPEARKAKP